MGPVVLLVLSVSSWVGAETFRPTDLTVVGILSQEYVFSPGLAHDYQGHKSYIAASYVKAVEASGAMVVPVFIGQTQEYYENIMNHINGLIIPGGAAYFNFTNGYKDAGKNLIHIAQKMNSRGDYFPILGICLGFELFMFVENKEKELRTDCNCFHENLSLRFLKNGSKTGLYKTFPKKSLKALAKNNITYNYHIWCITRATMNSTKLSDAWDILTESKAGNGKKFVSTVQSKKYPFVGIQFHPEKNSYEWNTVAHVNHSRIAIETSRLFYDWIVTEATKNKHAYPSHADLYKEVIYNYAPTMSYPLNNKTSFEQIYFFD